jgi:hypothetical protein
MYELVAIIEDGCIVGSYPRLEGLGRLSGIFAIIFL